MATDRALSSEGSTPLFITVSWQVMAGGLVLGLASLSGCASICETSNGSYVSSDMGTSSPVCVSGYASENIDESSLGATNVTQERLQEESAESSPDSQFASDGPATPMASKRPVLARPSDTVSQSTASHASDQGAAARRPFGGWVINPFAPHDSIENKGVDQLMDAFGEHGGTDGGPFGPDGPGEPGDPDGGPGGGPPGGFGGRGDEPGYSTTWYPSATVSGQGTKLGIIRQGISIDVPVWFKGDDMVMASVSVNQAHFSGNAILPDTMRAFPSDLWDVQFGLKHMRQYSNGWTSMLMFDIGSASDKPFHSMRDVNFQLGGFVMIPARNERYMWMLGAIYSPLGNPAFPIPLLSYNWKPSDAIEMNIGLPCSMKWQATDRLSLDLSYFPILSVDALATYQITDHLKAYGGYQNINDSWYLHDRADRQDQFLAIEQRLIVGLRRDFTDKLSFEVNAGYAFNRYFGVGNGMGSTQSNLTDRVKLDPGAFIGARLTWNF